MNIEITLKEPTANDTATDTGTVANGPITATLAAPTLSVSAPGWPLCVPRWAFPPLRPWVHQTAH